MRLQRRLIQLIASAVALSVCAGCMAKEPKPPMRGEPHGPEDVLRTPHRRLQRGERSLLSPGQLSRQPHLTLSEQSYGPAVGAYPVMEPTQVIPVWLLPQRHPSGDFAGGQWVFVKYKDAAFRGAPQRRVTVPVTPILAPIQPGPGLTPPVQPDPLKTPRSDAINRKVMEQFLKLQQSMGIKPPPAPKKGATP